MKRLSMLSVLFMCLMGTSLLAMEQPSNNDDEIVDQVSENMGKNAKAAVRGFLALNHDTGSKDRRNLHKNFSKLNDQLRKIIKTSPKKKIPRNRFTTKTLAHRTLYLSEKTLELYQIVYANSQEILELKETITSLQETIQKNPAVLDEKPLDELFKRQKNQNQEDQPDQAPIVPTDNISKSINKKPFRKSFGQEVAETRKRNILEEAAIGCSTIDSFFKKQS